MAWTVPYGTFTVFCTSSAQARSWPPEDEAAGSASLLANGSRVAYAKVTLRGPHDTRLVSQVVPLGTGGRADNVGPQFSHEREFILKTNQQPGVPMMFKKMVSLVLVVTWCAAVAAEAPVPTYKKIQLSDKFTCEGAYYGDFNRDGNVDVVAGPYWYAGPDYQQRHEVREPKDYDPKGYSDNFLTYTGDFNGDGWVDILYAPWPGQDASWYENPGEKEQRWTAHFALKNVGNESPVWGDVNGDGRPDLVYNIDGFLGYGTWDPAKPNEPWTFHPVSTQGDYQKYTHGVGIGDINGDGRVDVLEAVCWWEQPDEPATGQALDPP